MEKQNLLKATKASISEVLETMFFLPIDFTDVVGAEVFNGAISDSAELVKVDFSGVFSGSFLLLIPDDLALFLTASFLGNIEEKVLPAHISETKKEMVNMIAGNTFTHFDDQLEFDLGIPEIIKARDMKKPAANGDEVIYQSHTLEKFLFVKVLLDG